MDCGCDADCSSVIASHVTLLAAEDSDFSGLLSETDITEFPSMVYTSDPCCSMAYPNIWFLCNLKGAMPKFAITDLKLTFERKSANPFESKRL